MERRNFLKFLGITAGVGLIAGCKSNPITGGLPFFGGKGTEGELSSTNYAGFSAKPMAKLTNKHKTTHTSNGNGNNIQNAYIAEIPGPCPHPIEAISRANWGASSPIDGRLKIMGAVSRITIHHEGSPKGNWDNNSAAVARTLRRIQYEHRRRMNAADIGYHYIIDRSGRVWQGRSHLYQGAHIKSLNPHNIGVMVLGNFDIQYPTQQQVTSLQNICHMLLHGYGIPISHMKGHGDLANTRCPGKNLKPYINKIGRQIMIA